jgi:hypothetical protein
VTEAATRVAVESRTAISLVDGDIHIQPANRLDFGRYMTAHWRRHLETFGGRGPGGASYPRANKYAARSDSYPPNGKPPGSDLDFLRHQLLDTWNIDIGVLNPLLGAGGQRNLEFGAALATAINEWQFAEWLDPEPRLRGSVVVEYEDGELAAEEIHRVGDDPRLVHVLLSIRTAEPMGRRKYWPMYEAAVAHDLPVGVHFGGSGGSPITGTGFPSFYIEDHAGMPTVFQSQVISLVCEGVFERFPDLKIVLIEGGFGWLPSLMWRLDEAYGRLREEVPALRRLPSEYIREHFWITTQPMEEPPRVTQLERLLDQLNMNDRLMFATDYPHWDFDAPDHAIPGRLPADLKAAIRAENAVRLYGLRPAEA